MFVKRAGSLIRLPRDAFIILWEKPIGANSHIGTFLFFFLGVGDSVVEFGGTVLGWQCPQFWSSYWMDDDHPDYTAASDIIVDLVSIWGTFKKRYHTLRPSVPWAFPFFLRLIKIRGMHRRPRTLYVGGDSTLAYNYDSGRPA